MGCATEPRAEEFQPAFNRCHPWSSSDENDFLGEARFMTRSTGKHVADGMAGDASDERQLADVAPVWRICLGFRFKS